MQNHKLANKRKAYKKSVPQEITYGSVKFFKWIDRFQAEENI